MSSYQACQRRDSALAIGAQRKGETGGAIAPRVLPARKIKFCVRDWHDLRGSDAGSPRSSHHVLGFIRRCGDDGNGLRQNAIVGRKDGGDQARAKAFLRIGGVSGSTVVRQNL